jgi:nucleoside phosphorylase
MPVPRLLLVAAILLPGLAGACEPPPVGSPLDGLCAEVSAPCVRTKRIAILSAFPGEQRMLRSMMTVAERIQISGRTMLVGQLAGQEVVLSLTGIGLVNATNVTTAILDHLDVSTILFTGVSGGDFIGDVIVPDTWFDVASGRSFPVDQSLLADVSAIAATNPPLERCLTDPQYGNVCVLQQPRVAVGGVGQSSDPYNGSAVKCFPSNDPVFGCEARTLAIDAAVDPTTFVAVDMESAAVAAVATARGVPFVIFRGASDGPSNTPGAGGDPLNLPGFPATFNVYYPLAAKNSAAILVRLLGALPVPAQTATRDTGSGSTAACDFERAASVDCRDATASRRVTKLVSKGCAFRAQATADPARAKRRTRQAATAFRSAAAAVKRGGLTSCCVSTLRARLKASAKTAAAGQ